VLRFAHLQFLVVLSTVFIRNNFGWITIPTSTLRQFKLIQFPHAIQHTGFEPQRGRDSHLRWPLGMVIMNIVYLQALTYSLCCSVWQQHHGLTFLNVLKVKLHWHRQADNLVRLSVLVGGLQLVCSSVPPTAIVRKIVQDRKIVPDSIRSSNSITSFKKNLKTYLYN